jgi:hypothetical protein
MQHNFRALREVHQDQPRLLPAMKYILTVVLDTMADQIICSLTVM